MIPLAGYVYFDKKFVFSDGQTKEKLFVILCDSPLNKDNVLVARTTSKTKSDLVYGCHFPRKYDAVFFMPENDSSFDRNTWVQFDYLMEYRSNVLEKWNKITDLSLEHTKAMLNCGSESYTLPQWQRNALKEHSDLIKI